MDIKEVKREIYKGIIAVIRVKEYDLAKMITETLLEAGFKGIELTMTIENGPALIKEMKEKYPNGVIGAGTIMNAEKCLEVIENGADFVVSPCKIDEVATVCNEHNTLCMLGIATPTEAFEAYNKGCSIVKAFPGDVLKPQFIKDIKGPMPYIDVMPSGGVALENIGQWFANDAYAVSVGSALYKGINKDNLEVLTERAKLYLEEVEKHTKVKELV